MWATKLEEFGGGGWGGGENMKAKAPVSHPSLPRPKERCRTKFLANIIWLYVSSLGTASWAGGLAVRFDCGLDFLFGLRETNFCSFHSPLRS